MDQAEGKENIDYDTWFDDFSDYANRGCSVDLPRLFLWNLRDRLSPEVLRRAIVDIWGFENDGLADLPNMPQIEESMQPRLNHDEWSDLFTRTGYFAEESDAIKAAGNECPRPTRLYRYAEHGGETGMSWTVGVDEAKAFETETNLTPRSGCVWAVRSVDGKPLPVFAHLHDQSQGSGTNTENEFIFDPRGYALKHVLRHPTCKQNEDVDPT